ncbi:MAG: hypothetical protein H6925_04655 [Holosporaceae bacterium]|nr:MAG: hypothetical protein H6925_04655 [Holosporaceae bacterium]
MPRDFLFEFVACEGTFAVVDGLYAGLMDEVPLLQIHRRSQLLQGVETDVYREGVTWIKFERFKAAMGKRSLLGCP